ncbi:MAG: hypothetical protein WBP16_12835 [Ferruginibacter sp.]
MSTIISAVIIVVAIVLIFWLLIIVHKNDLEKKAAGLIMRFNEAAYNNNLAVTETETLNDMVFGMDVLYGKLLILELTGKNKYQHQIIDLYDVMRCTLQKNNRTVYEKGTSGQISEVFIEKVNLLFEFTDRREPYELVFYRHVVDHIFELPQLEEKAVKWQELISKKIKNPLRRIA